MDEFALQGFSPSLVNPDANRRGLLKQELGKVVALFGCAQYGHGEARPVLFHLGRAARNVQRSAGEGLVREVAIKLRAHVIQVGFEHRDQLFSGRARVGCRGLKSLSKEKPRHIGLARHFSFSGAITNALDFHGRHRPEARSECGHKDRARRCHEFCLDAARVHRDALEQFRRGGRGDRQRPVLRLHSAAPNVQRRTNQVGDFHEFEPRADADHVNDGVHRPDFVEMDFLGRFIVQLPFDLRQPRENFQRAALHASRQGTRFEQPLDFRQLALRVTRRRADLHARAHQPAAHGASPL